METLNSYLTPADSQGQVIPAPVGGRLDPRFPAIAVASVAAHVVLFAGLLTLSWASIRYPRYRSRLAPDEKVTLFEAGPSSLRLPPETPEHVDTSHLAADPHLDDTHLIARAPNPGFSHGSGKNLLPTGQANSSGGGAQEHGHTNIAANTTNKEVRPPSADPVQINQPIQPDRSVTSGLATAKPIPPPPPAPAEKDSSSTSVGKKAEDSGAARQLGYRAIEGQYRSYVRAKIYKENERIMPRSYIEGVLAREVSAEFAVSLERSGRLKSVRLVRSCGYSSLDDVARQAIYLAGPFEGFPPEATDPMDIDITVHYTPFK